MTGLRTFTLLILALAMSGCGGGGGGSAPASGGSSGGGGGASPPNTDGTGEIIFPWTTSGALTRTVTVSGTASDPDGVAGVSVNGVAASVSVSSVKSARVATSPSLQAASAPSTSQTNGTEVSWSAQVELSSGNNTITISVEDANGGVTQDADTATIKYVEVPITFTLDPDATRVVGLSNTLTRTGIVQNLMQYNYDTDEQTVFGNLNAAPSLTCFRRFEDEFMYLSLDSGNTWNLHQYTLASGQDAVLSNLPAALLDGGAGFQPGSVRALVCGDTNTSAYVLINFVEETGQWYTKSRIVEIDLATLEFSTLSETDSNEDTPWMVLHIALDDEAIVGLHDISPLRPLTRVALTDGARSDLTPGLNIGGFVVHPELASDLVYVATFEGIDKVDLNAGTRQNVSIVSADDPLAFAQIRAIGFDAANNRVIVGDESLDTLIAIDVSTGERSQFISRRVGEGNPLVAPRKFAISADASRAYVADDGGNVAERLFEIDLTTGDRRVIGDISQPFNYLASGLALDEAGRRVFVSFRHRILAIDLDTEEVSEVANVDSTVLEFINGLLFDPDANRLLISDSSNDGIYSLSLDSGAIEVVSRDGDRGSGAAFGTLVSLTGSGTATEIFAAGQSSGTVFQVNMETGDRQALATTCDLGESTSFQGLMQIRYNAAANELLILADTLYSLNFDTDQCDRLPPSTFLLEVQPASAEQLLAVTFGALLQVDRDTGEVVVVSK